ncbi:MAG: hypothetical protein D6775_16155 [Caldilineae bacterium]|nr:MAG: hypothetical protein D6775_16155 [Caldilineae bacterium]
MIGKCIHCGEWPVEASAGGLCDACAKWYEGRILVLSEFQASGRGRLVRGVKSAPARKSRGFRVHWDGVLSGLMALGYLWMWVRAWM